MGYRRIFEDMLAKWKIGFKTEDDGLAWLFETQLLADGCDLTLY